MNSKPIDRKIAIETMTKSEKKVSIKNADGFTIPKRRTGEKIAGAVTPIYFHQGKIEDEDDSQKVEIPVKIDLTGSSKASNTTKLLKRRVLRISPT